MATAAYGRYLDEVSMRRMAFDLIPQLPTDVELAHQVLAQAIDLSADPMAGVIAVGPAHSIALLADEILETLRISPDDRRRVLCFARMLVAMHLRPNTQTNAVRPNHPPRPDIHLAG